MANKFKVNTLVLTNQEITASPTGLFLNGGLITSGGGSPGGSPGGSNRQIQYNDGGSFGGSNNLIFHGDNTLGLNGDFRITGNIYLSGNPVSTGGGGAASSGPIIQYISAFTSGEITTSSTIPSDSTKPQVTEGENIPDLALTITGTPGNKFIIFAKLNLGAPNGVSTVQAALFRDSGVNSISSTSAITNSQFLLGEAIICHQEPVVDASGHTFTFRFGSASTSVFNRINGLSPYLGGTLVSFSHVMEVT